MKPLAKMLKEENTKLKAENDRLRAENKAMAKDAARLDYISKNWFQVSGLHIGGLHNWICRVPSKARGANVREAIDAEKSYMEQSK